MAFHITIIPQIRDFSLLPAAFIHISASLCADLLPAKLEFRIIRLTELILALLDKVDAGQLALNPAVELSYLTPKEQTAVAEAMAAHEVKPSLSQAVRLKKLKQDGKLTPDMIDAVLSEEKNPSKSESSGSARYRGFFPPDYSQKQIDAVIVELLTGWKARN